MGAILIFFERRNDRYQKYEKKSRSDSIIAAWLGIAVQPNGMQARMGYYLGVFILIFTINVFE